MTVTLTATGYYQVLRCAPRGRPRRAPSGWAATPIGVDGRTGHTTWLVYDPATHNVAKVIGISSAALRRQLLGASCHQVTAVSERTVYLVPRHRAASALPRPAARRGGVARQHLTGGPSPARRQEANWA